MSGRSAEAETGAVRLRCVTPALETRDLAATVAFYRDVLGFEVDTLWPDDDPTLRSGRRRHGPLRGLSGLGEPGTEAYPDLERRSAEVIARLDRERPTVEVGDARATLSRGGFAYADGEARHPAAIHPPPLLT